MPLSLPLIQHVSPLALSFINYSIHMLHPSLPICPPPNQFFCPLSLSLCIILFHILPISFSFISSLAFPFICISVCPTLSLCWLGPWVCVGNPGAHVKGPVLWTRRVPVSVDESRGRLAPISFCPATVASYFTEKINNFNKHQWTRAWFLVGLSAGLVYVCVSVNIWAYFATDARIYVCLSVCSVEKTLTGIVSGREIDSLMNSNREKKIFFGEGAWDSVLVWSDRICCRLERPRCPFFESQRNRETDGWREGWMDGWCDHFWGIVDSHAE